MSFYNLDNDDIDSISLCIISVFEDIKIYFNFNLDLSLLPTSKKNIIN